MDSLPKSTQKVEIRLPSKPQVPLVATFTNGDSDSLIVFLNGLGLPQSSWYPTISNILEREGPKPSFLTYDRFGQGETTSTDPLDEGKPLGQGHDLADVTKDVEELIAHVSATLLDIRDRTSIILVANSIGCSIARYFAETNPGKVSAILILDSTLANSDFVSIYPDPLAPDFDEGTLLGGLTAVEVESARKAIGAVFLPTVPNKESFWRGNQAGYLPLSDGPKLRGDNDRGPWVTVMGHDFDVFADESTRMPGVVRNIAVYYTNPFWHKFNQDLVKITDPDRGKGPIIAEGAGHFIQQGRPDLVANELWELMNKVAAEDSTV